MVLKFAQKFDWSILNLLIDVCFNNSSRGTKKKGKKKLEATFEKEKFFLKKFS